MREQPGLKPPLLSNDQGNNLNQDQRKHHDQYFCQERYLSGQGMFNIIFFRWICPLLTYGWRVPITEEAVPRLRPSEKPDVDYLKFNTAYQKEELHKRKGIKLTKSIFKAFWKQAGLVLMCATISTGLQMYTPILTHDIISYISKQDRELKISLIYFLSIFVIRFVMGISQSFLYYYFTILGYTLSNTLSLLIFNKTLKHPLLTEKDFEISDIINLSQVDAQRMTNMGFQLVSIFFTPFQILIGLFLLYYYLGPVTFVGLGVMIVLMIFTLFFTRAASRANDDLLKAKDARMKVTQEILHIIKFIKINAIEKFFFQKLNKKREKQLKLITKVNMLYVLTTFIYWLCPPLIISLTFLVYSHLGGQITAAKAFFTIIIFNLLQYPIRSFPTAISALIQMWSSIKRIENYLQSKEMAVDCVEYGKDKLKKYAIEIEHGYFLWGKQKQKDGDLSKNYKTKVEKQFDDKLSEISASIDFEIEDKMKDSLISTNTQLIEEKEKYGYGLENINYKFAANQVTMIIGDIGSGKSSLLFAILNEMTPDPERKPKVRIHGKIAYAPQKPWIMSGTLKDNIIFNEPEDAVRLNQAIHYAGLEDDLKILGKGVNTEIGERGANLSGGQKARISLARALYSNRDIYLLDDVLSAVDVHVGKFLMEKTILGYLKGKTVIMPTHAISYLQKADHVLIMKRGKIVQSGLPSEIKSEQNFKQVVKIEVELKKSFKAQVEQLTKEEEEIIKNLIMVNETKKNIEEKKAHQQSLTITDQVVEQLIMPEDHKKGDVTFDIYKQYIKLNGGILFAFAIVASMMIWTTMATYSNIQIKNWCDSESKTSNYLHLYLAFAIGASFFSGVRAYILVKSSIRQGRLIQKKMIKSLLYTSIISFYNRVPVGRILNRLSKDLREVDQSIGYAVGGLLVSFFSLLSVLVMCVYASTPWVSILVVITAGICVRVQKYYLKTQRECVRLENITTSPIVSGFTSVVSGVATIRAYGKSSEFLESQMRKIDTNKRMRIAREALESWFAQRLSFLSFFISMSAIGFCLLSKGENASLAGLLLTYAMSVNEEIINTVFSFVSVQTRMIAIERVSAFMKIEAEPGYKEYCQVWRTKEEGADYQAFTEGSIVFDGYSTRYREGLNFALKEISLKIKSGEKVGIVGRTGAGKSTIINALLRILEPVNGRILIDGKDILDYHLKDLRACITMIEQQPTLISGTFKDNLDPDNKYSEEELKAIIKQCYLEQMIKEKGGIGSRITNENLSVGEKQLLCICRAFLKRSKLILIDEATANIDVRTDKLIQKVISTKFKASTVLTIAHRLETLKDSDKILVLGKGEVLEWGTRKSLMSNPKSIYRKMSESNDHSYLE